MSKTVEYQGYRIHSAPEPQAEGATWQVHIFISVADARGVHTREFSSEGAYVTYQDADTHGIAFGERIIDGKVDGRSVGDLKASDRRATPRFRVQFRTTFSTATNLEGSGCLLNLSLGGCRVESPVTIEPGASLELRIYVPALERPLMMEMARVQWVSGQIFGLRAFRTTDTERQRLRHVIMSLMGG